MKPHILSVRSTAALVPLLALLATAAPPTRAQGLSCEQLRDRIAAGATWPAGTVRLDIVGKDEPSPGRQIGSCEQGTRRIMAVQVDAAAQQTKTDPPQPPEPRPAPEPPPIKPPEPQPPAPRPPRAGGVDEATLQQYRAWIAEARQLHPYPESEDRMFRMMMCESKGNAGIESPGGRNVGLFQFSLPTWNAGWNAAYRDSSRKDPRSSIFAVALAWSLGMQSHWPHCYRQSADPA